MAVPLKSFVEQEPNRHRNRKNKCRCTKILCAIYIQIHTLKYQFTQFYSGRYYTIGSALSSALILVIASGGLRMLMINPITQPQQHQQQIMIWMYDVLEVSMCRDAADLQPKQASNLLLTWIASSSSKSASSTPE